MSMYTATNYQRSTGRLEGLIMELNTLDTNEIHVRLPDILGQLTLSDFLKEIPAFIRVRACLSSPLLDRSLLLNGHDATGTPFIVDNVNVVRGDLLLITNQTPTDNNGVFLVGDPILAPMQFAGQLAKSLIFVEEGRLYANALFALNNDDFVRISGTGGGTVDPSPVTIASENGGPAGSMGLIGGRPIRSVGGTPPALIGPNNLPPALRTRYLTATGGAVLKSIDNLRGIEISAPNAVTTVRIADIVSTNGQFLLHPEVARAVAWSPDPVLCPGLVFRCPPVPGPVIGDAVCVLADAPGLLGGASFDLEFVACSTASASVTPHSPTFIVNCFVEDVIATGTVTFDALSPSLRIRLLFEGDGRALPKCYLGHVSISKRPTYHPSPVGAWPYKFEIFHPLEMTGVLGFLPCIGQG